MKETTITLTMNELNEICEAMLKTTKFTESETLSKLSKAYWNLYEEERKEEDLTRIAIGLFNIGFTSSKAIKEISKNRKLNDAEKQYIKDLAKSNGLK